MNDRETNSFIRFSDIYKENPNNLHLQTFVVCAMFTPNDNKYFNYADRLAESCEKFNLPYSIYKIPYVHTSTSKNGSDDLTYTKANFILFNLNRFRGKNVLYVDVDIVFLENPDVIIALSNGGCDFAIYNWLSDEHNEAYVPIVRDIDNNAYSEFYMFSHDIKYKCDSQLICSGGVQFYRNSESARLLLKAWLDVVLRYPFAADDECLDYAYNNFGRNFKSLNSFWLEKSYLRMPWWPHVKPVIIHLDIPIAGNNRIPIPEMNNLKRFYPEECQVKKSDLFFPRDYVIDTVRQLLLKFENDTLVDIKKIDQRFWIYHKTLSTNPQTGMVYFYLGSVCHRVGFMDEAVSYYEKAVEAGANVVEAYNNLGVIFQSKGQLKEALAFFQKAVELNPKFAQAFNNMGNTYRDLGMWDQAIESFQNAVELKPDYYLAHYNIGTALSYRGMNEEAVKAYEKAILHKPDFFTARLAKCMSMLPIIYDDEKSIEISRKNYTEELLKLQDEISIHDIGALSDAVGTHQPFLLACQGMNNKELQKIYGEMVCSIMGKRYPEYAQPPDVYLMDSSDPIRVGIVTEYFHYHSVWKIPLRGWIEKIDKRRFHIYGYHTGKIKDEMTEIARRNCKKFVEDVFLFDDLCRIIKEDKLHIIIYPEIGMDATTLRLASLKLAPIQCVSLGHPDTTGMPTIDYYLSSDLMEPLDADDHYTEKLIRLPNLGFHYVPLEMSSIEVTRENLGLRINSTLFLCSHALFSYLPQYDEVFPQIAKKVGDCQFLFIAHENRISPVTEKFYSRIKSVFDKFKLNNEFYTVFLPALNPSEYQAVNKLSDVFLDSIGWSSNNSTFEALAYNLPIVTLPGKLMRQRHCAGILKMLGVTETIASSPDEYVDIAVRLGKDLEWRTYISNKIAENKYRIYKDMECIIALENFLEKAVKESVKISSDI